MLTFDNFKQIFHRAKKTQWILYKGNGKGQQIGSNLSDEAIDADESLSELEDIVSRYGDGVYTVECRSNRTASRGNDMHTFMYGDGDPKTIAKGSTAQPAAHPAASFFAGLDAKYFMEQSAALNTQVMKLQMELMRKEMEVAELKRDLKETEKGDDGNSIAGFVNKNPMLVNRIIDVFAGNVTPTTTRVGVLKTDAAEVPPEDEDEGYEPGKIDVNALIECAQINQKAIPDMHPNEVFDKLADWVEANPAQAANMLKMI